MSDKITLNKLENLLNAQDYFADESLNVASYLAVTLERPLLLEGEAGVGKTELAKALSKALALPLIRLQCYEGLDQNSALYEWDHARQIIEIRLHETKQKTQQSSDDIKDNIAENIYAEKFLLKRPILQALQPEGSSRAILLIDELDRADEPFEAFLLEILSDFQITIPELGVIKPEQKPIVIITSNRTREIHDAIKRRCFYHWLDYPERERELMILRRKLPNISSAISQNIIDFVHALRQMDLFKRPGIAETIDWARAIAALDQTALTPELVSNTIGVLLKYQDDIARIKNSEIQGMLNEIQTQYNQELKQ